MRHWEKAYLARTAPQYQNVDNRFHREIKITTWTNGPAKVLALAESLTFSFSGRTAPNRFLKAPMTERLCSWDSEIITKRGVPSVELINLYKRWGEGQAGVIVTGNIMIAYDAVEGHGNPILCDDHDGRVAEHKKLTAATRAHGSLVIAQLSHPGRQGPKTLNPHPVSASDVQMKVDWAAKPRALTVSEIGDIVGQFAQAAYLCWKAGYDGVQLHGAHGYLVAQFLSQTTNKRVDQYGGDLDNRSRIVFEIIHEIRQRVPDPSFLICVKLNSVEFQDGGFTPDECKALCIKLEEARVDFVDLSGGTLEVLAFTHKKDSTKAREAYFIEFADMIKPNLKKTKVYVTGGLRSAQAMANVLETCDGVGLGTPMGGEPYLCKRILEGAVCGAIKTIYPQMYMLVTTGTQMHQVGRNEALTSDFSSEEEFKRWVEEHEKLQQQDKDKPGHTSSGYPQGSALHGFDYLNWEMYG